jgi:Fe2+ transport system protein B
MAFIGVTLAVVWFVLFVARRQALEKWEVFAWILKPPPVGRMPTDWESMSIRQIDAELPRFVNELNEAVPPLRAKEARQIRRLRAKAQEVIQKYEASARAVQSEQELARKHLDAMEGGMREWSGLDSSELRETLRRQKSEQNQRDIEALAALEEANQALDAATKATGEFLDLYDRAGGL